MYLFLAWRANNKIIWRDKRYFSLLTLLTLELSWDTMCRPRLLVKLRDWWFSSMFILNREINGCYSIQSLRNGSCNKQAKCALQGLEIHVRSLRMGIKLTLLQFSPKYFCSSTGIQHLLWKSTSHGKRLWLLILEKKNFEERSYSSGWYKILLENSWGFDILARFTWGPSKSPPHPQSQVKLNWVMIAECTCVVD